MKPFAIPILAVMLVVSAQTPAQASETGAACKSDAYRQFDFFVGDWDASTTDEPSKIVARNRVTAILNGCVIYEDYRQTDGLHGKSFSLYDAATHKWHQSWVTNRGELLLLDGRLHDGKLLFQGERPTTNGGSEIIRVVWFPDNHNVRETATRSTDGGKSWKPVFDIVFTPHRQRGK